MRAFLVLRTTSYTLHTHITNTYTSIHIPCTYRKKTMFIGRRREIALLDGFINALLTRRKDAIDGCMIDRVRDKKEERIVPRERDYLLLL